MERMTVDVNVGKAVKEFIVSSNGGSDILDPEKDTILWCLMKQHLVTRPGYLLITDRTEYIYITLRNKNGAKTYSVPDGSNMKLQTLFRSYLDATGQAVIKKHFEKEFKKTFRDYMKGALNNNPDMKIVDAIAEFCSDHNVCLNNITISMLQKDWYRFRAKCAIKMVCPLCF